MNQKSGKRWSAVRAFLDPMRSRKNLPSLLKRRPPKAIGGVQARGVIIKEKVKKDRR